MLTLRIEDHQDQGARLFFVVSGEGETYRAHGTATSFSSAKKLRAAIRREMKN